MAKIYISSTYEDLKEYREEVYRSLQKTSHTVIAMENYGATDKRPLDKCLEDVASCDLYIGIFAWRYGYIPEKDNPDQKSITELEYRKAREKRIPCHIFLLDKNTPWLPGYVDTSMGEGGPGKSIRTLREDLEKAHISDYFNSASDLAAKVFTSITNWEKEPKGQPNWQTDVEAYRKKYRDYFRRTHLRYVTYPGTAGNRELPELYIKPLFQRNEEHKDKTPPQSMPVEKILSLPRWSTEDEKLPYSIVFNELFTSTKQLVATGEPGAGKTTFLKMLGLNCLKPERPLPVFIELADYALYLHEHNSAGLSSFYDFIAKKTLCNDFPNITPHFVQEEIEGGSFFLLLDALDEIRTPKLRKTVVTIINELMARNPSCHVVVSIRTASYGYEYLLRCQKLELLPLTAKQIKEYITKWIRADASQLIEKIETNSRLVTLFSNPLLLNMWVSQLGKNPLAMFENLPDNRFSLYEKFVRHLIAERPHERNLRFTTDGGSRELETQSLRKYLTQLAYKMHEWRFWYAREGNVIDTIHSLDATLSADETKKNVIDYLVQETGLIQTRYDYSYTFCHFSFQEFFAAEYMVKYLKQADATTYLFENSMDPWWHEVIMIYYASSKNTALLQRLLQAPDNLFATRTRLIVNCLVASKIDAQCEENLYRTLHGRLVDFYRYSPYIRLRSIAYQAVLRLNAPTLLDFLEEELRAGDRSRCRRAIESLGKLASEKAEKAIDLLVNKYWRGEVERELLPTFVNALVTANPPTTRAIIGAILGGDSSLAPQIIDELLEAANEASIQTLLALLVDEQWPDRLKHILRTRLGKVNHPAVRDLFAKEFHKSANSPEHAAALLEIIHFPADEVIRVYALELLNAQQPKLAQAAARFFRQQKDKRATDSLVNLMINPERPTELRLAALLALQELEDPDTEGYIIELLRDENVGELLTQGVITLGRVGGKQSVTFLQCMFSMKMLDKSSQPALKATILESLWHICLRIPELRTTRFPIQDIIEYLRIVPIEAESTAKAITWLFWHLGKEEDITGLMTIAPAQPQLSTALITYVADGSKALHLTGGESAFMKLLNHLINTPNNYGTVDLAFRMMISRLPPTNRQSTLRRYLNETNPGMTTPNAVVRLAALELASTELEAEAMQPILLHLINDKDPDVVAKAIELLGECGDKEAAQTLRVRFLNSHYSEQTYLTLFGIATRNQLFGDQLFMETPDA